MKIEQWLFRAGVPTYKTQIFVDLTPNIQIEIGNTVPENIGWIYGLACNVGGTDSRGAVAHVPLDATKALITMDQSYSLWLQLKYGTSLYIDFFRLSNLAFNQFSAPVTFDNTRRQEDNYCPVSIPADTDWKKSLIINTEKFADATVMLDMYFIDKYTMKNLQGSNVLWQQGVNPMPPTR